MKIQDFKDFEVLDFVEEDNFRKWVISKDKSLDFFWFAYLKKYPQQEAKMEEAKQMILASHDFFQQEAERIDIPEMAYANKINSELQQNKVKHLAKAKPKKWLIIKIAAACCLLILAMVSYSLFNTTKDSQINFITGHGEWKEVILPDGSKVELNANTQLSLTEDWEKGVTRCVWLKGEAFFKVKKIPSTNAKFKVITKDLEVDVLGTTFNVNTRNDHTEVFLEEGKILLDMQGELEHINPGEFISYSGTTKKIINRYEEKEEIHSKWKNGVLKITDANMKEILNQVESIYGIDLIVKDEALLNKEGSVAIPVDDLDMATSILERVLNVKMVRKGKQIFID